MSIDDPAADVVAAGGVLWRPDPSGRPEIAVVHRPRYDDWSLPKGKLADDDEPPLVAAARELTEETGFAVRLGHQLGEVEYQVPEGRKVVFWWAARAVSGQFVPNAEVDQLRWMAPGDASVLLSYRHDQDVLGWFQQHDPTALAPLLLVRHAKAGSREEWHDDDALRPLTAKGVAQAERLAELLALFGPTRVCSAPPVRCVQTVDPLSTALGVEIRIERLLGEDDYWDDPEAGLARLLALAGEPGVAVVCSQGEVIPDLIGMLTGEEEPPSRKASTWVLGFAGDQVVTSDYYQPPKRSAHRHAG